MRFDREQHRIMPKTVILKASHGTQWNYISYLYLQYQYFVYIINFRPLCPPVYSKYKIRKFPNDLTDFSKLWKKNIAPCL